MAKMSARKLTLWELQFHFNHKNNKIESKRFWVRKLLWKDIQKESFIFLLRNESYLIASPWYWWQMKEHFIILTNLTFQHLWLFWSHFSIAEYMRCQLITTLHFDFSKRFSALFVLFFNRLHLAISFIGW